METRDPTVFILANGQSTRWLHGGADAPKQLAQVDGEPVLGRTVRLLVERGVVPVVVSGDESLRFGAHFCLCPETRNPCETLLHALGVASDGLPGICLLGDVFFTDGAIDEILRDRGVFTFYGRRCESPLTGGPSEPFGFRWSPGELSRLRDILVEASKEDNGAEAFWAIYRLWAGFPPHDHLFEGKYWVDINDFTDDFDTVDRYRMWLSRYQKRFVRQEQLRNG